MTELKNSVYKFVQSHEYLLTPLTNAALGFSVGGFYGALVGFGVGALDEGLLYNGITEQRYLSATFMGGATLTSFRNVNQVSMTNEIQEFEYTLATAIISTFQASKKNSRQVSMRLLSIPKASTFSAWTTVPDRFST